MNKCLYVGILRTVLEAAVDGALVLDLCVLGDTMILEETRKVYKREKEMKKGNNGVAYVLGVGFIIQVCNLTSLNVIVIVIITM